MRIVVLDGFTLNPGDLTWTPLEELGPVTVFDRTSPDRIVERAREAEIVLTNKTPLRAETIRQLPKLKYIGVLATGFDVVDIREAGERGVPVTNVPDYSTSSVGQLVFALLLELCHRVGLHSDAVRGGAWTASPDFCFWNAPLVELAGKTMGIVGLGRIGEQVARLAQAFGMDVVAYSRSGRQAPWAGIRMLPLDELLRVSDVVSLHCPLTPETEGMIHRGTLERMKPSAFLINTARGKLVVEQDLADALNRGALAGAALDVLAVEPPPASNPLLSANNCIITPHIAWATREARSRLLLTAADNIRAFLAGTPQNVVNGVGTKNRGGANQ